MDRSLNRFGYITIACVGVISVCSVLIFLVVVIYLVPKLVRVTRWVAEHYLVIREDYQEIKKALLALPEKKLAIQLEDRV